jgi:hypothetical protein
MKNFIAIRNIKLKSILTFLFVILATSLAIGQIDFGAYYTKLNTGQEWEAYSRTGIHADIIVQLSKAGGQLVFWRGNSYLPYWKTDKGQWNLTEIIPRSGDGAKPMPDRVNIYSHVEIIENTPSVIIVHWRYLSSFTAGNPHGNVNPNNFAEEVFTITPDGKIKRIIKKGTDKIDDWNDPLNQVTQVLQLSANGISEISRTNPGHSVSQVRLKGNPVKGPVIVAPCLEFNLDEGLGDNTKEKITQTSSLIPGHKTVWKKGVSGTALEFDGYNTVVSVPASRAPVVSGGSLTLEGWFALGAYPWNWAPIVQQGDDDGYFLGIDSHGYPGFMVKVDGVWEQLRVPNKPPYTDVNHIALFKWYQIAGTYNKNDGMMRLYTNGNEISSKLIGKGGIQTSNADVRVGKAGIMRKPTEDLHDTYPSEFSIDGLIDEVKVYNVALGKTQVAASYANFNPGTAIINMPDMQKRKFPDLSTNGEFKAIYTHLPYYETWENMFRFGDYADVVVGFDQLPTKFVFWKGVSYIPMMVNDSNQWYTNEFCETGWTKDAPGDCEPMSDKGSWDSHVRVIENNGARVVVNWRYRLAEPGHHWANYNDTTGWGDIADWDYYIYPDGIASKIMRWYSSESDTWHEWDEQIVVLSEGQHPESVVRKAPVMTLVDTAGITTDYDWNPNPPHPQYKGKKIQMIYFTGQYNPFTIQNFNDGDIIDVERTWYSVFPSWNHWPTSQINSSGRNSSFPDRAAHSSISHLFWPFSSQQRGKIPYDEKILMEGMTNQPATLLISLAKSWLKAPDITNVLGGTSLGYNQSHRAYCFTSGNVPLSFQIGASDNNPIQNLCFEIKNWKSRTAKAKLKINGVFQTSGPNFRQGVNIDTDGTYTLIIWLALTATSSQSFEITNIN